MRALILAAALAAGSFLPALQVDAGEPVPQALHSRDWYAANSAVRLKTLEVCYSDASYQHLPDCENAAMGESLAYSRRRWQQSDMMANPTWWRENAIARRGAAQICTRPSNAAYRQYAPYCSLILATELQARG